MGKYGLLSTLATSFIARLLDNGLSVLFCTFQNFVAIASALLVANQCLAEKSDL